MSAEHSPSAFPPGCQVRLVEPLNYGLTAYGRPQPEHAVGDVLTVADVPKFLRCMEPPSDVPIFWTHGHRGWFEASKFELFDVAALEAVAAAARALSEAETERRAADDAYELLPHSEGLNSVELNEADMRCLDATNGVIRAHAALRAALDPLPDTAAPDPEDPQP